MEISTQFTVEQWHLVVLGWILYFLAGVVTGRIIYRRSIYPTDAENSSFAIVAGIFWPLVFLYGFLFVVTAFLVFLITFKNGKKQ